VPVAPLWHERETTLRAARKRSRLSQHLLDLTTEVLRKILDLGDPGPDHGALFLVGHLPPLTRRYPSRFHARTVPPTPVVLRSDPVARAIVLLIAAHVLGDINRWWIQTGEHLPDGPDLGEVYRLLHQVSVEAEAAWSLLPDRGDGTRVFSIRTALLRISLLLVEQRSDIIVLDIRIPPEP